MYVCVQQKIHPSEIFSFSGEQLYKIRFSGAFLGSATQKSSPAPRRRLDGICEIDLCRAKRKAQGILCVFPSIFMRHDANIAAKHANKPTRCRTNKKAPDSHAAGSNPAFAVGPNYNLHKLAGGSPKFCFAASNVRHLPGGLQSADSNRHPLLEMWVYWAAVNYDTTHKAGNPY